MPQPPSQASWPTEIPGIRLHPTDLHSEELADEAKGWLLFVREESQPILTPANALRHRRALIERWATAGQEFREKELLKYKRAVQSYYQNAPGYHSALDYPAVALSHLTVRPNKRFLYLPSVDRKSHAHNYVSLVEFLILMYVHQDEWNGLHPFDVHGAGEAPSSHIPQLLDPGAGSGAPITLSEFLPALYLHTAHFFALSMTRDGTVIFADGPGLTWFVIDERGLATGRLTLADFGSNGLVHVSTLRRPWNMGQSMSFEQMLGRFLSEIAESGIGGPPQYNEPYVPPLSDRVNIFRFFVASNEK
ncbi:hypothetical protein PMG11_06411 [Penicillium brasilianum]|uniref:Uncharacterized protein n=1 Tax=Penicillium brasilianum TaxID=104259 RepID=A0A0F7TRS8_PENBI|nr:hypothetical protein PMG11_06411 [Penicillium brasilianum]